MQCCRARSVWCTIVCAKFRLRRTGKIYALVPNLDSSVPESARSRTLDGLEEDRADEARLEGKKYNFILEKPYRWASWAAPRGKDGKLDHNIAMIGDDLCDFVNQKLFPYLHGFKQKASGPNTIEYKIGEIFGEIKNKISSGYNLREIIDHIDELRFRSQAEKHELSVLYEEKIKRMGNAGRNGGEYYTPRPLIRAMIEVVRPRIGERIYDGACGSAGFLCESFDYLKRENPKRTTAQDRTLQETAHRRLCAGVSQYQAWRRGGQGVGRTADLGRCAGQAVRGQTRHPLRLFE
jgi:type I restriction-modification system DNA methylase subunit